MVAGLAAAVVGGGGGAVVGALGTKAAVILLPSFPPAVLSWLLALVLPLPLNFDLSSDITETLEAWISLLEECGGCCCFVLQLLPSSGEEADGFCSGLERIILRRTVMGMKPNPKSDPSPKLAEDEETAGKTNKKNGSAVDPSRYLVFSHSTSFVADFVSQHSTNHADSTIASINIFARCTT